MNPSVCFVLLGVCFAGIHGATQMCLHCSNLDNPENCHTTSRCHHGEMCGTTVHVNGGKYYFDMSCMPTHECPHQAHHHGKRSGYTVCQECCSSHNDCNQNLCLEFLRTTTTQRTTHAHPHETHLMTHAPHVTTHAAHHHDVCFVCDGASDPSTCHALTHCQSPEICGTQVYFKDNQYKFRLSCLSPTACSIGGSSMHHLSPLFGKRSTYNFPMCTECCDSHLGCNRRLCVEFLRTTTTQRTTHAHHYETHLTTHAPQVTTHAAHHDIGCYVCDGASDPSTCHAHTYCHSPEICGTQVYFKDNQYKFRLSCLSPTACSIGGSSMHHLSPLFGKRSTYYFPMCTECCDSHSGCNRRLCDRYAHASQLTTPKPTTTSTPSTTTSTPSTTTSTPSTTTSTPSTTTSTPSTTTSTTTSTSTTPTTRPTRVDPDCHDKEGGGLACRDFKIFNLCQDTDRFTRAFARAKCPSYCGFCTPKAGYLSVATNSAKVRPPVDVCEDNEADDISCAALDAVQVCTHPSTFAYVVAHEKCRKHCRLCLSHTQPTADPITATTVPMLVPTHAATTAAPVCIDIEKDGFKCIDYDATHFCSDVTSEAHVFAITFCRKHCGFCSSEYGDTKTTILHVPTHELVTATSASPCVDYEPDGFRCADYDALHFCSDSSSIAHGIAVQTCRRHCGFCRPAT